MISTEETRICTRCAKEKPIISFTLNGSRYRSKMCRRCDRDRRPWERWYSHIWNRCNNPNHKNYSLYGGRKPNPVEMRITCRELKVIWFRDKAYNMEKPSIDRIDSNGHYEFSNCRAVELHENVINNQKGRKR